MKFIDHIREESSEPDRVGIVILNYNKSKLVLECINSVFSQCYQQFDLIVVDNGSSDDSCMQIKTHYPDICLIESKRNLGVAGGRNAGISCIFRQFRKVEFILFLDNDALLDKHTILQMVRSFRINKKIGIVTPKLLRPDGVIEYAGGIDLNLILGRVLNIGAGEKDSGQYDNSTGLIKSSGGIFMIQKKLLQETGYFDERLNPYGWEDIDLSLRVRQRGYSIYYNYKAVIFHHGGKSVRGLVKEYEKSKIRNYFYLVKKHSNLVQLSIFYCVLPFRSLMVLSRQLRHHEYNTFLFQIKTFFNMIRDRLK